MAGEYEEIATDTQPDTNGDTDDSYTLQGKRYRIVKKRWAILALICCILLPDMFSFSFFSFINDLTSFYFDIQPAVADLQAVVNLIGRMVTAVVVCLFGALLSFRNITIFGSALNALSAILVTIGIVLKLYSLVMVGMFISGCASAIVMALIQLVAVIWFPFRERGKANATVWVARRMSYLFSSLIATRSLGVSYSYEQLQEIVKTPESVKLEQGFKLAFSLTFGLFALSSIICCVISKLCLQEHPPYYDNNPPSENAADEGTPILTEKPKYSLKREFSDLKILLTSASFILIFFIYGFVMTERPLGSILVSSLVLAEFPQINDQTVGVMLAVGIVLASVCSPITGIILDKFTRPRLTYICLIVISIAAVIVYSICFQLHVLAGVFASFLILWSTRDGVLVCMTHRLSGIMSNQPDSIRVKAYTLPAVATAFCGALGTTCIRLLMENFNSAVAVLFPLPFMFFGLFSYIFLWKYLQDQK